MDAWARVGDMRMDYEHSHSMYSKSCQANYRLCPAQRPRRRAIEDQPVRRLLGRAPISRRRGIHNGDFRRRITICYEGETKTGEVIAQWPAADSQPRCIQCFSSGSVRADIVRSPPCIIPLHFFRYLRSASLPTLQSCSTAKTDPSCRPSSR